MSTISSLSPSAPRIEEQPRRTNAVGIQKYFLQSASAAPSAAQPVQTRINNAVVRVTAPRSFSLASVSPPPSPSPSSPPPPSPPLSVISEQTAHSAQTDATASSTTTKSSANHRAINSTDMHNANNSWLAAHQSEHYCRLCYKHRCNKILDVNPRSQNRWIDGSSALRGIHWRKFNGTIHTILHRYGITTKELRIEPIARNTPQQVLRRFQYARKQIAVESSQVIYIDEMGFSLHRRRGRGRSLVGRRATITRANARGGNISVCAAISPTNGLLKYKVKVGGFNGNEYAQFLTELVRDYAPVRRSTHYFVMDNVRFHHSAQVVAVFEGGRVLQKQVFVPAYSPQLNAIEECFSSVAWFVNQRRVDNKEALLPLIDQAFGTITAAKCLKWHETVIKWLQHCLDKKPIGSYPGEEVAIDDDENILDNDEPHVAYDEEI